MENVLVIPIENVMTDANVRGLISSQERQLERNASQCFISTTVLTHRYTPIVYDARA